MNPIVTGWIDKPESDFRSMQRELRARTGPSWDNAGLHAQQCVEKYLKARLTAAAIDFPKTHDLAALLGRLNNVEPLWAAFANDMKLLSQFAVETRYPGVSVTEETARKAGRFCRAFRKLARAALGLP